MHLGQNAECDGAIGRVRGAPPTPRPALPSSSSGELELQVTAGSQGSKEGSSASENG